MMQFTSLIENYLLVVSSVLGIIIALYSLYESLRNKQKFNQLNRESLISKVAIDFDYKTEKTDQNQKIVKGKMTFTNKGTTNLKMVELNFDVKDRSDEFEQAFVPNTADEKFSTTTEGIHSIDLLGFNNSKQLSFKNPKDKYFQVYRMDSAYIPDPRDLMRHADMDANLEKFIQRNINEIYELFKNFQANKEKIIQRLIGDMLIREIRGFQLFPGESMTQEFVASYTGSGSVILNVEASSLRFLQRSVTKGDEFKILVDQLVDSKQMDALLKEKLIDLLKESLQPTNDAIIDHRKTFLMYLP